MVIETEDGARKTIAIAEKDIGRTSMDAAEGGTLVEVTSAIDGGTGASIRPKVKARKRHSSASMARRQGKAEKDNEHTNMRAARMNPITNATTTGITDGVEAQPAGRHHHGTEPFSLQRGCLQ